MAAMKPRTGEGPLEVTKEGRGLVMRVPLEGGGRLVVELSPDEARERTVRTTRRFVRRQRSWFRRDPATTWFDAARPDLLDAVSAEVGARRIER